MLPVISAELFALCHFSVIRQAPPEAMPANQLAMVNLTR
jgi:hypothetical protein